MTLPADRLYAIENGPSGFDPMAPAYFPKIRFLMLMRNERLAALRTDFDDRDHVLTVRADGRIAAQATCGPGPDERRSNDFRRLLRRRIARSAENNHWRRRAYLFQHEAAAQFFRRRPAGRFSHQPGLRRGDRECGGRPGRSAALSRQPLRQRLAGLGRIRSRGQGISVGAARLKGVRRIKRCAATDVEPETGIRDMNIPQTLMQAFGHADCGLYTEVVEGGAIAAGDSVTT